MGKIYAPPEEIGRHPNMGDFLIARSGFNKDGLDKAENEWEEKLRAWCKERSKDKIAGEIVKEPLADGQAMYMVLSTKPVQLIHIPFGDAYEFQWAHRWTASDIKLMVKKEHHIQAVMAEVQNG